MPIVIISIMIILTFSLLILMCYPDISKTKGKFFTKNHNVEIINSNSNNDSKEEIEILRVKEDSGNNEKYYYIYKNEKYTDLEKVLEKLNDLEYTIKIKEIN